MSGMTVGPSRYVPLAATALFAIKFANPSLRHVKSHVPVTVAPTGSGSAKR